MPILITYRLRHVVVGCNALAVEAAIGHDTPMMNSALTVAIFAILTFGLVVVSILLYRLIASRWRR